MAKGFKFLAQSKKENELKIETTINKKIIRKNPKTPASIGSWEAHRGKKSRIDF